jgi:predicted nucleic acid-binding protein
VILVDTSVWSEHFKRADARLNALLSAGLVLGHELVLGELACGTPPAPRGRLLASFADLPQARISTVAEAMALLEREQLYGRGLGLIDVLLLASALITPGTSLLTLDKRLDAAAGVLGVSYNQALQ